MLIRIGALSEQTGVSADVLRSWERRYGLLIPQRTAGGFRLYSNGDVVRIRSMTALIAAGISASEAARQVLETGHGAPTVGAGRVETPLEEVRAALHNAFRSFDELALEAAIDLVLSRLDLDTGVPTGPPATAAVPVYPTRISGGGIEVGLPANAPGTGG